MFDGVEDIFSADCCECCGGFVEGLSCGACSGCGGILETCGFDDNCIEQVGAFCTVPSFCGPVEEIFTSCGDICQQIPEYLGPVGDFCGNLGEHVGTCLGSLGGIFGQVTENCGSVAESLGGVFSQCSEQCSECLSNIDLSSLCDALGSRS